MDKPWFMYDLDTFTVPFGNPAFDSHFGGAHDLDIGAPPNYPVTALLSGTIVDISAPEWGKQVGIRLDQPYNGIPHMSFLHLSAVNPALREGSHVAKGDLIGWVGGGNNETQYQGTSNPTGHNFLNSSFQSSRTQVGVALTRGPVFGGTTFQFWPPIEWDLDPSQIIFDARKDFLEGEDMLQITDSFAAAHFTQTAENRWHCTTTNLDVALGILSFYRSIKGAPRLPLTGEQHDAASGVTYQVFEAGIIVYDPEHKLDHITGFDQLYLLKLNSDLAKRLLAHQGS